MDKKWIVIVKLGPPWIINESERREWVQQVNEDAASWKEFTMGLLATLNDAFQPFTFKILHDVIDPLGFYLAVRPDDEKDGLSQSDLAAIMREYYAMLAPEEPDKVITCKPSRS